MLNTLDLIGKAARAGELDLVFGLVVAVAAAALGLPEDGRCERVLARDLGNVIDDAVLVNKVLRFKMSGQRLVFQASRSA